jgi:hypothetical protein
MGKYRILSEMIFADLNKRGADLGNASIGIIERTIEKQEKLFSMHSVMTMFAPESNEGNEKRAELIKDYKAQIKGWKGNYGQGFADCFNWLNRAFKAN